MSTINDRLKQDPRAREELWEVLRSAFPAESPARRLIVQHGLEPQAPHAGRINRLTKGILAASALAFICAVALLLLILTHAPAGPVRLISVVVTLAGVIEFTFATTLLALARLAAQRSETSSY